MHLFKMYFPTAGITAVDTFIVSGLGVVGIWVGGGSIPGACRRPDAAGDLGSRELAGHL